MENIITYDQLERRLKNKPIEEWTKDDVFDRYVGYGNQEEIDKIEIQRLFVKHGLYEELINLVDKVITDEEIVDKILNSSIFENKKIRKIKGKIKDIKFLDIYDDDIDELKQVSIIFEKEDNKEQLVIKDFCFISEVEQYLQDKNKYENKIIIAIIEEDKNEFNLKCFCKVMN